MTKIRALKDSPLAKQGEVFEGDEQYYFTIGGFCCGRITVDKWIAENWFEIVEERKSLLERIDTFCNSFISINAKIEIVKTAREHAIEIVKDAHTEFYKATYDDDSLLCDYIIEKLEEKMR